jgi:transposase
MMWLGGRLSRNTQGRRLKKANKRSEVVKGMILNGLGLVSSPLYLFSRFFEGKATEHLLGKGIFRRVFKR